MKGRFWFKKFPLEVNEANAYLIACPLVREAMLVDAGEYPAGLEALLAQHGFRLRFLFLTHGHGDHVAGAEEVRERHGAEILMSRADSRLCGLAPDRFVEHGERIPLGQGEGVVLETPGHTPGSLSLHIGEYVFVGDALFAGAVGGTASPEEFARQVEAIRRHLFTLPDSTIVCPGHGPCTTIGVERVFNGFFVE